MYNVSVRPSKIVTKTRRGINHNMENSREQHGRKTLDAPKEVLNNQNSGPRPVFNTNQRKTGGNRQGEAMSPEHNEVVQFVSECWTEIWTDYEKHVENNLNGPSTVIYHEEKDPNKLLEDFKPFDLEAWWGRRLFNNLTKNPT